MFHHALLELDLDFLKLLRVLMLLLVPTYGAYAALAAHTFLSSFLDSPMQPYFSAVHASMRTSL